MTTLPGQVNRLNVSSWLLTLAGYYSSSVEVLVTNVIEESMRWNEITQLVSYLFKLCIALASSLPSLMDFAVQSLLAVSLCQLTSTEEENSWEYDCALHQFRTLHKNLSRRDWGNYWCFLTSSSCCSQRPTVLL